MAQSHFGFSTHLVECANLERRTKGLDILHVTNTYRDEGGMLCSLPQPLEMAPNAIQYGSTDIV